MNDRIKINTEQVAAVVSDLRTKNDRINRAFENFRKKAISLESTWNSAAGSLAGTLMYQIFNGNDSRCAVMDNYIALLEQQVIPGAVAAETVNTKLGDEFK